jgi:hypothetical protein
VTIGRNSPIQNVLGKRPVQHRASYKEARGTSSDDGSWDGPEAHPDDDERETEEDDRVTCL